MCKMKLKVPVSSLKMAKQQIKAGADEFYVTYSIENFRNLTFSGRNKETYGNIKTEVDYSDFKEIVKLAHDNNVIVEMAANTCRMIESHDGNIDLDKIYLDYVEKGIAAGADRVIVGDIGNIILVRKAFPQIPITAGVYLQTYNKYYVKLLESLGVHKIVLDHCVTIPEIEDFVNYTKVKIEVFAQFGCSFMLPSCGLHHAGIKKVDFGLPCRAKYHVKNTSEQNPILDVGKDCSICVLEEMRNIGVESVKIVGRDIDSNYGVSITHIYSYVLSMIEENVPTNEILDRVAKKFDFDWWKKGYCHEKRCKYKFTEYHI